jgi:hypothetical protein
MTRVPTHITPLKLTARLPRELTGSCPPAAFTDLSWMGTAVDSARPGTRRFLTDLSLPIREHSPQVMFRKAAFVDVGLAKATPTGCEVDIGWRSASLAPLFPVFAGRLVLSGSEVTLEGLYAPPGGQIGAALDHAFFNIAARGTARWFLEQVEAALLAEPSPGAEPLDAARPLPGTPTPAPLRRPGTTPSAG